MKKSIKSLLLICLTFFTLGVKGQVLKYCYQLGQTPYNLDPFYIGNCNDENFDAGDADAVNYFHTELLISFTKSTTEDFPTDLSFDIEVVIGANTVLSTTHLTASSFNSNHVATLYFVSAPTTASYQINITSVTNTPSVPYTADDASKTVLDFDFTNRFLLTTYIYDQITGNVIGSSEEEEDDDNCSTGSLELNFISPQIQSGTFVPDFDVAVPPIVCVDTEVDLEVDGLDENAGYNYTTLWAVAPTTGLGFSGGGTYAQGYTFKETVTGAYVVTASLVYVGSTTYYANNDCYNGLTPLTAHINVIAPPNLSVSPVSAIICKGSSVTLNASGASFYLWNNGGSTNQSITVNPSTTTTYNVTGTNTGCSSQNESVTVTVGPAINFNISTSSAYFCPNSIPVTPSVTLTATNNANYTYTWNTSTGVSLGTTYSISVAPLNTTTYSCSVIANGCTETKSITITVPTGLIPAQINVPYGYQCDNGYIQYFNAVDPNSGQSNGQSYVWSTVPPLSITQVYNGITNQYISIDFTNVTTDVDLYLTTTQGFYGCPSSTSIPIYQCCKAPANIKKHNYITIDNGGVPVSNAYYNNPGNTYYVTGQLRLTGNSTIDGTNFVMNPGASILVDGTLNINNSHIYACTDMWRGIEFFTFGSVAPVLNVTNSLIEDAEYGVNIAYSSLLNFRPALQALKPVVTLNNAWFNRCAVGVAADYDVLHPDSATNFNPTQLGEDRFNSGVITANNCMFSCLNGIDMTRVQNQNYNTIGLAPGYLHSYLYKLNFYTFCGIAANSTSLYDINGNQNVIQNCYFDNLVDGIVTFTDYITGNNPPSSNLNVYNCNFQRAHLDPTSENYNFIANFAYAQTDAINHIYAIGGAYYYPRIYLAAGGNNIQAIIQTQNGFLPFGSGINFYGSQLNVGGASTATSCTFSASDFGVVAFSDGSASVDINYNSFVKANATYPYSTKNSGIYLTDELNQGYPVKYSLSGNTFKDHYKQGITAKLISGQGLNSYLNASNNNFTATANFTTANNFSTNFAMAPEAISLTGYSPLPFYPGNDLYFISNNTITNYEQGITAYNAFAANINSNTINMFDDVANYTYGISAVNCTNALISNNTIKASTSGPWQYGEYGIFTQNSGGSIINCNTINGPDISLKCQGPNNTTTIEGNSFLNAAVYNFDMSYAGFVGPQGTAAHTNGNKFSGNTSAFWVDTGTDGTQSPFYYRNTGNQIPVGSGDDHLSNPNPPLSQAIPLGVPYAVSKNTPYYTCAFLKTNPILNPVTARKIAADSLHFSVYDTVAVFGNQHDLYRALVDTGAAYYNADAVLSSFMAGMAGSAQEKLLITDTLLNTAGRDTVKINQAIAVNNSFVPAGKHDAYLQKANNLYAAFKKGRKYFTAGQLQSLKNIALLCPFEYGDGVYKARALMTLFDTLKYVNSCEQGNLVPPAAGSRVAATIENVVPNEQTIKVYPNPAQNQLFIDGLQLQSGDNAEVQVYSTLGQLVLRSKLNNGITPIGISSLADGSYFYKVVQNGNVVLTDKLIILK